MNTNSAAYTVYISGQIAFVNAKSLSIVSTVGRRSTASLTVHTRDTATHFQQYQQIQIYDQNNILAFSGYLDQPQERKPGYQPSLEHTLTCVDQHFLADKRLVAAAYTNKSCGAIVQDIFNTILSQEGVTIGQIYDGIIPSPTLYPSTTLYPSGNVGVIPSATFVYCTVAEAMDQLVRSASASGVSYYWQIDQNKALWFVPYTAVVNPKVVDGTLIDQVGSPTIVQRHNPTYRNRQYVLGGYAQTAQQTETRIGDGNTTAWTMGYELAAAPTITVDGVPKSVGVKGTAGSQYYWGPADPLVTQASGAIKLTSANTLQIVYIGQYPTVIVSENGAQIAYEASLDGSTGLVEMADANTTIRSLDAGLSLASQLLNRYSCQGTLLQFTTRDGSYAQGQQITVTLPPHNLYQTQMLIEEITASDQTDGINIWYTIKAVAGPYDTTWVAFFATLLQQSQTASNINAGIAQTLTLTKTFSTSLTTSTTLTSGTVTVPYPSATLYPGVDLYPG